MSYPSEEPPLISVLVWLAVLLLAILAVIIELKPREIPTEFPTKQHNESYLTQPNIAYYPKYKYSVLASITGYSMKETCSNGVCITASGQEASKYLIACPYNIPLGSRIEIVGMGNFVCGDRTSYWVQEKYGPTFDIWFNNSLQ